MFFNHSLTMYWTTLISCALVCEYVCGRACLKFHSGRQTTNKGFNQKYISKPQLTKKYKTWNCSEPFGPDSYTQRLGWLIQHLGRKPLNTYFWISPWGSVIILYLLLLIKSDSFVFKKFNFHRKNTNRKRHDSSWNTKDSRWSAQSTIKRPTSTLIDHNREENEHHHTLGQRNYSRVC